ncbi:MAG: hypothetical protein ACLFUO_04270 [Candidatus Woesearchaeota archaeon]
MELGMAYVMDIPVIGICRKASTVSRSQKVACKKIIDYDSVDNIVPEIKSII